MRLFKMLKLKRLLVPSFAFSPVLTFANTASVGIALILTCLGSLVTISKANASTVTTVFATGFDGLELITQGPGGDLGSDLYVATAGSNSVLGGIYTVTSNGVVTPFITGYNVISVAFDTENILGGGMFFADEGSGDPSDAGKIWRVTSNGAGNFNSPQLFADFSSITGSANKPWQITITAGENGFASGLYATTGPFPDGRSGTLYRVDFNGSITEVKNGFNTIESLVFARGNYGDGILTSDIRGQQIQRLLADGTVTTFASLGSSPLGPAILSYGPDNFLYVTDFASGDILKIDTDGTYSVFATLPLPPTDKLYLAGAKPIAPTSGNSSCLISGIFTAGTNPTGLGSLYSVCKVPEPSTSLSILALGTLGAASTLNRKLKPSKSTEKEATKVS